LAGPQPPAFKDAESDIKDNLISLPPNALVVGDEGTTVALTCYASFPSASMTLTGTLLATEVSSVTVS
jgi:hypothetical protein